MKIKTKIQKNYLKNHKENQINLKIINIWIYKNNRQNKAKKQKKKKIKKIVLLILLQKLLKLETLTKINFQVMMNHLVKKMNYLLQIPVNSMYTH